MSKKTDSTPNANLHRGHRARLRERFFKEGPDSFSEHNLLEYMLTFVIPRKDTNELAHLLINRFGSLNHVLDASLDELIKVDGIGRQCAVFLTSIPYFARYYLNAAVNTVNLADPRDIPGLVIPLFIAENKECVYVICLDSAYNIISAEKLCGGTVDFVHISARMVAETALKYKSSIVVIAHNHPLENTKTVVPSANDILTTKKLISALKGIDIKLYDHIIVNHMSYVSLLNGKTPLF